MNSILAKLLFLCALFSSCIFAMDTQKLNKPQSLLHIANKKLIDNLENALKQFRDAKEVDFSLVLDKVNALLQKMPNDMIPELKAGLYERYKEKLLKLLLSGPFQEFSDDESDFYVQQMEFSPAGGFLAVVKKHKDYRKKQVEIYSLPDFKLLKTVKKIPGSFIKFSPRGKFLCIYSGQAKNIALINMASDFEIKNLALETGTFTFNDDESMILCLKASKNSGNSIEVIDLVTEQSMKADFELTGTIVSAEARGDYIFVGMNDNQQYGYLGLIFLITLKDRRLEYKLIDATDQKLHCGCLEFDLHKEKGLFAISSYERARIFDFKSSSWVHEFKHYELINSLSFDKNGTKLLTSSDDWTAATWDLGSNKPKVLSVEDSRHIVQYAGFTPHEHFVFTSDSKIRLWDISKPKATELLSVGEYGSFAAGMTKSPDGMFFAPKDGESIYCFGTPAFFTLPEIAWLCAASDNKNNGDVLKNSLDEVFQNRPLVFKNFLRKIIGDET